MAPKKAAKKKAKKHGGDGDLRRAYEHLHRVRILHTQLGKAAKQQVDVLLQRAQGALASGADESAADLLRAAEHFGFGSLAPAEREKPMNQNLADAALAHYEHLAERANKHWEDHEEKADAELDGLFHEALETSEEASEAGAMYRALEYVRAADALASLDREKKQLPKPPDKEKKKLRA